jgi:K+-transporting ATPase ATPase C chain
VPPGGALDVAGIQAEAPATPHIRLETARSQVDRIVKERQMSPDATAKLHALLDRLTEEPKPRLAGEPQVNLLRLNLALDELK